MYVYLHCSKSRGPVTQKYFRLILEDGVTYNLWQVYTKPLVIGKERMNAQYRKMINLENVFKKWIEQPMYTILRL